MSAPSIVSHSIIIHAPADKVWEVLSKTKYIRQWDEVPEDFEEETVALGSVIEWTGYSKMTVTVFEPPHLLKFGLYLPKVALAPEAYDVSYAYELKAGQGETILLITIGDFSPLPKAEEYHQASAEFAETSARKIKELSESL